MTLAACAALVERGDPDRFLAAMAAPAAARAVLLPLYAFNLEVARAPQVTAEPLIAEMRLQWWRDALAEIGGGGAVRRHEVATPLAEVLDPEGAQALGDLVEARRRDIRGEPFADAPELAEYLDHTAGTLMWTAARLLGAQDEGPVRAWGRAQGLANWLLAVPALAARGQPPFAGPPEALAGLAGRLRVEMRAASPSRAARPATLAAWRAPALLRQAERDPAAAAEGRLGTSEFVRRGRLLWVSFWL